MVQLRGSFRKLGDTKPTKDQCLHLHLVGTVLGLTHLQKNMQYGHAKLLSRFHYTPLHPAESTAQRPQHTYMYIHCAETSTYVYVYSPIVHKLNLPRSDTKLSVLRPALSLWRCKSKLNQNPVSCSLGCA